MEQNYSRKKNAKIKSPFSGTMIIVVILLFVNTLALIALVGFSYQSFSQANNQDLRLQKMESKIGLLDKTLKKSLVATDSASSFQTTNSLPTTNSSATTETSDTASRSSSTESAQSFDVIDAPESHVVQPGETLSIIAEKYGFSVEELMLKNNLSDSVLVVDQVLIVH